MSADEFVSYVSQIPFVLIFFATLSRAIQKPRRTTIDIALLFGSFALIVVIGWITAALDSDEDPLISDIIVILLCSLPYLLLRVVADFIDVPTWLLRVSEASLAFIVVATLVLGPELPGWFVLAVGVYFVGLGSYASVAFFKVPAGRVA